MEEKEKISQDEIERLAQLAQVIDKMKTNIDQFVDEIDPGDKHYTLGIFWAQYHRAFKFVGTVFFILVPIIWAIFGYVNKIESKFNKIHLTIEQKFEDISKNEIEINQNISKVQNDVDEVMTEFRRTTPSDIKREVEDLRRKLFEVSGKNFIYSEQIESDTKDNGN